MIRFRSRVPSRLGALRRVAAPALLLTLPVATPSSAQTDPAAARQPATRGSVRWEPPSNGWQMLLQADIDSALKTLKRYYIYASYPGGAWWDSVVNVALAKVRREMPLVRDLEGFRAVYRHFVVSFEDAHLGGDITLRPTSYQWPKFLVRYKAGKYAVVESETDAVPVGAAIASCDGKPLDQWMDEVAEFEGWPKGLETTRTAHARILFVDSKNPLYPRPRRCRIGDEDVDLVWTPISASRIDELNGRHGPFRNATAGITPFGANGSWVVINSMMPSTTRAAEAFNSIIRGAKDLRNKDVIVIDVRGNRGGTYAWFAAFLRELYGAEYADYYARARLEIRNVMMSIPIPGADDPGFSAEQNSLKMPDDPPMQVDVRKGSRTVDLPNGNRLTIPLTADEVQPRRAGPPPPNPVKARVYVLTDVECASACLSFVDEMMRFPGVTQIGTETHIDRRSGGWPGRVQLPSGIAYVGMGGRMVRENRKRGENETWVPTHRFPGDISDTAAVQRWITEFVLKQDAR